MLLIFFDEVKPQPDYPHYHIGAVCIDEENVSLIEQELEALANQVFDDAQLSPMTEFHAVDIYHRKKGFRGMVDVAERISIIERLLQILSKDEVGLIDIQINTDKLAPRQSPEEISFMFLCERANDFVRSKQTLGMLIGDRENDSQSERFSVCLSGYRAKGTDFAFGRDIENLFESVHFTHSHLSRFLQLADMYAWILQFLNRNRHSTEFRHQAILDVLKKDEINLFPSKYKEWPKSDTASQQ